MFNLFFRNAWAPNCLCTISLFLFFSLVLCISPFILSTSAFLSRISYLTGCFSGSVTDHHRACCCHFHHPANQGPSTSRTAREGGGGGHAPRPLPAERWEGKEVGALGLMAPRLSCRMPPQPRHICLPPTHALAQGHVPMGPHPGHSACSVSWLHHNP